MLLRPLKSESGEFWVVVVPLAFENTAVYSGEQLFIWGQGQCDTAHESIHSQTCRLNHCPCHYTRLDSRGNA